MTEPLRKVDLNLLLVFDILWTERSVSAAAKKIGISQSAMSLSLNRLRKLFDDNLFVWNGRSMQTTGKCEELSTSIHAIVNNIRGTVLGENFDAGNAVREFTIASADYIHWALGGEIIKMVNNSAPGFTLYLSNAKPEMTEGYNALQHEMFILPSGTFNTFGLGQKHLFVDRYIGVAASENHLVREGMCREEFLTLLHASFSTDAKYLRSHETKHLSEIDVSYKFNALTPNYLVLPFLAAKSDLVVIMQERLARYFADILPIRLFIPPIPYPDLDLTLYWHKTFDHDAAHVWLRSVIETASGKMEPLPSRELSGKAGLQFVG